MHPHRPPSKTRNGLFFALLALLALSGCQSPGSPDADQPADKQPQSDKHKADTTDKAKDDSRTRDAVAAAEKQADQLNQALSKTNQAGGRAKGDSQKPAFASRHPSQSNQKVDWIKRSNAQKSPKQQSAKQPDKPNQPTTKPKTTPKPEPAKTAGPKPKPLNRKKLIEMLSKRIAQSPNSALSHAASASMLASIEPGRTIPASLLEPLSVADHEKIARFQSIIALLRHQLLSDAGKFNRQVVDQSMDQLFENLPVHIQKAALCRKVEGYGVYDPFDTHTFHAGRAHKMIVYIELSDFEPKQRETGKYEVRLRQELALYTESDGQKVWQHKPVEIVDVSRNRRRDFFVVQMITLPAELGVGKYVLKVDVLDKHGGSVDAKPIPINLVADDSLARDREVDQTKLLRRLLSNDENQTPLISGSGRGN